METMSCFALVKKKIWQPNFNALMLWSRGSKVVGGGGEGKVIQCLACAFCCP